MDSRRNNFFKKRVFFEKCGFSVKTRGFAGCNLDPSMKTRAFSLCDVDFSVKTRYRFTRRRFVMARQTRTRRRCRHGAASEDDVQRSEPKTPGSKPAPARLFQRATPYWDAGLREPLSRRYAEMSIMSISTLQQVFTTDCTDGKCSPGFEEIPAQGNPDFPPWHGASF